MLKSQSTSTQDWESLNVTNFTDGDQDGNPDEGFGNIIGDNIFYNSITYPFQSVNEYDCTTSFNESIFGVSQIRAVCNDGTTVTLCDADSSADGKVCDYPNDWTYYSGDIACNGDVFWYNSYKNTEYWNGDNPETTFSEETSVGQIFIYENSDPILVDSCKLELNTGNLTGNSIDDSSGNVNKGLLIGDYNIKKTQKGQPMIRDSFIKVPKKNSNTDGAL
jgi:hypothetical protein